MTETEEWLEEKVPGFRGLNGSERKAIFEFTVLWSLFELKVFNAYANADRICDKVDDWQKSKMLNVEAYDKVLAYFRERYCSSGEPTHHFGNLHLPENNKKQLVWHVLENRDSSSADCVKACLIIVHRYRNNLFHGEKWKYNMEGQLDNFDAANSILKAALEQHGNFLEGQHTNY